MKNYTLLSLLFIATIQGNAQKIGDIKLNSNFAATLSFNDIISNVVIGNLSNNSKKYYDFTPKDPSNMKNMIVFSTINPLSPKVSLTIQLLDGSTYVGVLVYDTAIVEPYFKRFPEDGMKSTAFRPKIDSINMKGKTDTSFIAKRLRYVMQNQSAQDFPSLKENQMYFTVENIMNDKEYTYIHLSIDNTTGTNFSVRGVTFRQVEGKVKNIKDNDNANDDRFYTVYKIAEKEVLAYTKGDYGFVIPLFSTGINGHMAIVFAQKNGTRNTTIIISAEDLARVKVFEN